MKNGRSRQWLDDFNCVALIYNTIFATPHFITYSLLQNYILKCIQVLKCIQCLSWATLCVL